MGEIRQVKRRSRRRGVIHAGMGPDVAVDGVLAVVGEARTDAGELQRGLEEGFLEALAFRTPIPVAPLVRLEKDGRNFL